MVRVQERESAVDAALRPSAPSQDRGSSSTHATTNATGSFDALLDLMTVQQTPAATDAVSQRTSQGSPQDLKTRAFLSQKQQPPPPPPLSSASGWASALKSDSRVEGVGGAASSNRLSSDLASIFAQVDA